MTPQLASLLKDLETVDLSVSNPNTPFFHAETLDFHWQMTRCEKYAFIALLNYIRPKVSLEIGTYKGGSLQIINKYSEKVYCVDINDTFIKDLSKHFTTIDFRIGSSRTIVPDLIRQFNSGNECINFVLIDGDHSTEGVKADINNVLELVPKEPVYIVFHDSFNPDCRKGILQADWAKSPYIHYVEIDYIPGVFYYEEKTIGVETAHNRSMWGGLSLAIMLPEKRTADLQIFQSQKGLFDSIYQVSSHKPTEEKSKISFMRRLYQRITG